MAVTEIKSIVLPEASRMMTRVDVDAEHRRLRVWAGLTQTTLAQKAKVGRATISRIENGKMYAHTATLRRLAKALNIDLVDLITDSSASPASG